MTSEGKGPIEPPLLTYNLVNYKEFFWASQMALVLKNPPASRRCKETWVQSLDWEDPLEEGMATHLSILAWRIPWTEEPGGLQSMMLQRVGED